jgi:ribosomal protein L11
MGLPPISIIGLGVMWDSSLIRVPLPPARITAFILSFLYSPQGEDEGSVTKKQVREIAERKMKDLNAGDIDAAMASLS